VGLEDGRPDFGALQQGSAGAVEYWVFDLPWLLGQDLRHLPIESRKSLLAKTIGPGQSLKVVPSLQGDPRQLLEKMCRDGGEGLVAKRPGSNYREGRGGDWYKLKCGCRQELVIGGFTSPSGTRTGFGALLLGYWRDGHLMYAGKVGTGFTQATLKDVLARLVPIERPSSPFAAPVPEKGPRWVEPQMVAEVAFSNWTREGRLRHPSFLGLRPDKVSEDVGREDCGPGPGARN
jgi:bifunctional non-homologous end joining protein LigD